MKDLTESISGFEDRNISSGGFGIIRKATLSLLCNSVTGREHRDVTVAIKFPDVREGSVSREKILERWQREIAAGRSISHPNILPFLGLCDNPDPEYKEFKGIVLPYCANGNARVYVNAHPGVDRVLIVCGIAAALCALHSSSPSVVHGDIKGFNVLIDDNGQPCLADFGLSRICDAKGFTTESVNGTYRWMATELLHAIAEGRSIRTTTASDVWALGMTILELLTGEHPFAEVKWDATVLYNVVNVKIRPKRLCNPGVSDAVWILLQHCWSEDATARPDACHVGLVLDLIHGRGGDVDEGAVLAILNGVLDDADIDQGSHDAGEKTLPYMCKWPHCLQRFESLDRCIKHECAEFERRSAAKALS